MANNTVITQVENGIATVCLNRPDQLNALNLEMAHGLDKALTEAQYNPDVRVIVLNGAGNHFMAGGDIKWFHEVISNKSIMVTPVFEQIIAVVNGIVLRIQNMPKPVIASVHGAAAGFGLSLMAACDLALAANNAYFTLAYCHIGTSPDGGATYSLPRIVGLKRAMEIALLGDRFNAEQALQMGLVNRVINPEQLQAEASNLASRLALSSALASANTKKLINQSLNTPLAEQLVAEQQNFAQCASSPDFAEGIQAFMEKRKPKFN